MSNPVRILNLFTVMNRGGAETMVMNYYRNVDRTKVQFDFMVHRQERGAYDDEIEALMMRSFGPIRRRQYGEKRINAAKEEKKRVHKKPLPQKSQSCIFWGG